MHGIGDPVAARVDVPALGHLHDVLHHPLLRVPPPHLDHAPVHDGLVGQAGSHRAAAVEAERGGGSNDVLHEEVLRGGGGV